MSLTLPPLAFAAPQSQQGNAPIRGALIGGEHFVKHVIPDNQQGGIPAATIYVPESWLVEGKIEWNYGWTETPVAFSAHAENPSNAEAYFSYPMLRADYVQVPPNLRQYVRNNVKPGERLPMGAINLDPQPPLQTLAMFIRKVRGNVPKFQWVGKQDLPDLAKALGLDPWPNQHGIAIKIGYELSGQPVEEAFYGVYYLSKAGNPGGNQGQLTQINWGLQALQSFRAPAGALDKRMTVFAAIAKSVRPTPQWTERANAIDAKLIQMFNQRLKQGYDQLRAAEALREQVMKNEGEFNRAIEAQMAANREGGGGRSFDSSSPDGTGGGRSVADKWDDLYRGVDTTNDPVTGTSQHSFMEQYHWTDGFGNYRNSNDPNYDPSKDEPGNWQLMTPAE